MIQHFSNINTPLRSIGRYPKLENQEKRFTKRDWRFVTARSLWDLWSDPHFITTGERTSLNAVEAFDEWEEFALFASHYFLLIASNSLGSNTTENVVAVTSSCSEGFLNSTTINGPPPDNQDLTRNPLDGTNPIIHTSTADHQNKSNRRFGVLYQSSENIFCHHGGYGEQTRLSNADMYTADNSTYVHDPPPPSVMDARMCHTVTSFPKEPGTEYTDHLIVGGRSSPYHALGDCWFQRKHIWERVEDLPTPLYRHCAASVTDTNGNKGVLVYGGKSSNGIVMNDFLLWREDRGWIKLKCTKNNFTPRFGAAMCSYGEACGLLLGGMVEDGTILPESWRWNIDFSTEPPEVVVNAQFQKSTKLQESLCRFGACLTPSPTCLYLVGGISSKGILPDAYNIVGISSSDPCQIRTMQAHIHSDIPPPLLIGHSSIWDGGGLVTVGGGAVCFSFGNHSNIGAWKVFPEAPEAWQTQNNPWVLINQLDWPGTEESPEKRTRLTLQRKNFEGVSSQSMSIPSPVRRERIHKASAFRSLVYHSEPVVIEGLMLGSCCTTWTPEYLKRKVGHSREVRH